MSEGFPRRGEIWLVNFNPGRGSEQMGIRPALVVQNDVGNRYSSTTIVAAITTTVKKYPFTVPVKKQVSGLSRDSMVNLAQILTVDKKRLSKKVGEIPQNILSEVDDALKISLGIP